MKYLYIFILLLTSELGLFLTDGHAHKHHRIAMQRAESDLIGLENAIDKLYSEKGLIPSNYSSLNKYLLSGYIKRMPYDPWGESYVYIAENSTNRAYIIYSKGADKIDDLTLGDDVVFGKKEYPRTNMDKYRQFISYVSNACLYCVYFAIMLFLIFGLQDMLRNAYFIVNKWRK